MATVSVRLPDELAEWLAGVAKARGVSKSAVIVAALEVDRGGGEIAGLGRLLDDGVSSHVVTEDVQPVVALRRLDPLAARQVALNKPKGF